MQIKTYYKQFIIKLINLKKFITYFCFIYFYNFINRLNNLDL